MGCLNLMFSRSRNSWSSWQVPQVEGRLDGCTSDLLSRWLQDAVAAVAVLAAGHRLGHADEAAPVLDVGLLDVLVAGAAIRLRQVRGVGDRGDARVAVEAGEAFVHAADQQFGPDLGGLAAGVAVAVGADGIAEGGSRRRAAQRQDRRQDEDSVHSHGCLDLSRLAGTGTARSGIRTGVWGADRRGNRCRIPPHPRTAKFSTGHPIAGRPGLCGRPRPDRGAARQPRNPST